MTTRTLIKNGLVVNAFGRQQTSILIENDRILGLGLESELAKAHGPAVNNIVGASDCIVVPGGIDAHTHMDLPLPTTRASDNFETGTRAALFGGTTTIIDFANQGRGHSLESAVKLWHRLADGNSYCDYSFHVSVTDWNEKTEKEIPSLIERGYTSFKTFTAYSGMRLNDRDLLETMHCVRKHGGLVTVHAENGDMVEYNVKELLAQGKTAPKYHPLSRPPEVEAEAVSRVMDLAQMAECPLYIVHLSSGLGLDRALSHPYRSRTLLETCIQYLLLDQSLYSLPGFEGARYILSPPLRPKDSLSALWDGLSNSSIQVLATDHCPFNRAQRELGRDNFSKIPNGLPGVENRMELLFSEGVNAGRITLEQFVALTSANPAQIFGLSPQKGVIEPGADADIVIIDPKASRTISAKSHHMNCDESVYENWTVVGAIRDVFTHGKHAIKDSKCYIEKTNGHFLKRFCYKGFEFSKCNSQEFIF